MFVDELLTLPEPIKLSTTHSEFTELTIPKNWAQGRTAFGGISAAMVYTAIKRIVNDDSSLLRSFTTNFIGPLALDTAFTIKVTKLREGKSVSQYTGEVIQNGQVSVFSQACFGLARKSKIAVENKQEHSMPAPDRAKFIPQIPKVTPKFIQHFDLSIDKGGIPFTGKKSALYEGFMRFAKPPKQINDAHVIAMIDAWPPTLLQMLRWPAPASTVSWNVEFIHPHRHVSGEDWFAYKAETRQAADGYGHVEATIWDKHNQVVALSRQTVAVFD
ncbi:thioesterase family protein [Alteromonas sp. ASW11-130]|uniref:thioesterase family protein n=1 Tax=Alteromonas sp. ASW11-130 TaxID=3015775 RepID=UPI002241AB4C|nr:thioesterase family protein [Alteromonas sp. ASW11-130]MCW8090599.1 thioesterase family protein [Alteromonas sp. ASW11-130]